MKENESLKALVKNLEHSLMEQEQFNKEGSNGNYSKIGAACIKTHLCKQNVTQPEYKSLNIHLIS